MDIPLVSFIRYDDEGKQHSGLVPKEDYVQFESMNMAESAIGLGGVIRSNYGNSTRCETKEKQEPKAKS